jgi:hypothetical protein
MQPLPSILLNPEVHYRIRNSPPLVPIPSQTNPAHNTPIHLRLGLPSGLFPSSFPTYNICAFLFTNRATCPVHLNLLGLIILIIRGEKYKL